MSTDTLAEQVNLKKNKNLIGKEKAENVKKLAYGSNSRQQRDGNSTFLKCHSPHFP